MGSLATATDCLNLITSDILWGFYDSLWPDTLISYDQWIQQVCSWRLAADQRIEERQLSEIRQRLQNGQQLPNQIKQSSVLTKAAASVDGYVPFPSSSIRCLFPREVHYPCFYRPGLASRFYISSPAPLLALVSASSIGRLSSSF
jgi:hypothetical protein